MKIAILYTCTGVYSIFWKDFYESFERYFIKDIKKDYFVFTDQNIDKKDNVYIINQNHTNWRDITLYRYHRFYGIKDELKKYDYCYVFNANSLLKSQINDNFLPSTNNIVCIKHELTRFYKNYPYERNPKSTAFVDINEGFTYVYGAVMGAKSDCFIKSSKDIADMIDKDVLNNYIAIWQDESYYNRYIIDKQIKLFDWYYMIPEYIRLPNPKIVLLEKNKVKNIDFKNNTRL